MLGEKLQRHNGKKAKICPCFSTSCPISHPDTEISVPLITPHFWKQLIRETKMQLRHEGNIMAKWHFVCRLPLQLFRSSLDSWVLLISKLQGLDAISRCYKWVRQQAFPEERAQSKQSDGSGFAGSTHKVLGWSGAQLLSFQHEWPQMNERIMRNPTSLLSHLS